MAAVRPGLLMIANRGRIRIRYKQKKVGQVPV